MKPLRTRRTGAVATAGIALALMLPALPALAQPAQQQAVQPPPKTLAVQAADAVAAKGVAALDTGAKESFHRVDVTKGGGGLFYVAYKRSYHGLAVVGGDAVVVVNGKGDVRDTIAADTKPINVSTDAEISSQQAATTARELLETVERTSEAKLVVLAGQTPKLAYDVTVTGVDEGTPSKLRVFVDAITGSVLQAREQLKDIGTHGTETQEQTTQSADQRSEAVTGTGHGYYYRDVTIDTSGSAGRYVMRDPIRSGISCGRYSTRRVFTGSDNVWGNGSGRDLETACVDALYSVQQEWDMLGAWLGRNGINGNGGGFPVYVGLNQVNAFWTGSFATFGHSSDRSRQLTAIDIVAHEMGHAIFQTTPGGTGRGNETGGLNESTGDIFGTLTEHYADNPNDPADYTVGEEANLTGRGPIRYMANPSRVGHPNCYSSAIPRTEVHAAAGPQNHWFYLLAEGSANSPTCDGSTVRGLGIRKAGKIFYNGLLRKTSSWDYQAARAATLEAALALYPNSCREFNAVKAAWNAVNVPSSRNEPTCTSQPPQGDEFSMSLNPSSIAIEPGSSATVTVATNVTNGSAQTVSLSAAGLPSGVTATFSPATITSGDSATLTITASATASTGTTSVSITGDGSAVNHTVQLSLTVGSGDPVPPGCGGLPAWSSTTPYQPGDVVSHDGHKWESTWYSTGAEPGAPGSWSVWEDRGAC